MIDIFFKDIQRQFPSDAVDALDNGINTLIDTIPNFPYEQLVILEELRKMFYAVWAEQHRPDRSGPRSLITVDSV